MKAEAKRLPFQVSVAEDGVAASDRGGPPLDVHEEWWPEHLVLAALARCVRKSLDHHLGKRGLSGRSTAEASGTVTRREDGSWGFVEVALDLDVTLDSSPDPDLVRELVAAAERGCFVGQSLDPAPAYRWTVNGQEVA